jgi:hypothetical protein
MDWANSAAPADVQYPAAGVENAGYANNDPFPHEEANGIFARISQHVSWLREIFPGTGPAQIDEDVTRFAAAEVYPVELNVQAPIGTEQVVELDEASAGTPNVYFRTDGFFPEAIAGTISATFAGLILGRENMCKASGAFKLSGATTISSSTLDSFNLGSMNASALYTDAWEIAVTNNTGDVRGQIEVTVGYNLAGTDTAAVGGVPLNATAAWDDTNKKVVLNLYIWNSTLNDWTVIPPGTSTLLNPGGTVTLEIEVHVEVK